MSDWHDPAQREAAGMGADHDRQILEAAEKYGRPDVVVVRCPHTIGLCYDDAKHGMLANLPCPCNDRSEIVARIIPVDAEQDETADPYVAERIEQIRRTAIRVKPVDVGVFKAMLPKSVADLMAIAPADLAWLCALAASSVSQDETMEGFRVGGKHVSRGDYLALTSALEYGDDTFQSPAAHPRDLIEPLCDAMQAARDHEECVEWCDDCDQWERPRSCEHCHGSGCGPGTASGAYEECEWCAGDRRDHKTYTPSGTYRFLPVNDDAAPSVSPGEQEGQPEGSERCHHCGSLPDADGDHSCPCPLSDSECLEHTLHPVAAPAPVADDEAADVEILLDKLVSLADMSAATGGTGTLSIHTVREHVEAIAKAHAAVVRDAVRATAERIAEAIENNTALRLGHNVSVVCSCLRCEVALGAARIARETVSE